MYVYTCVANTHKDVAGDKLMLHVAGWTMLSV